MKRSTPNRTKKGSAPTKVTFGVKNERPGKGTGSGPSQTSFGVKNATPGKGTGSAPGASTFSARSGQSVRPKVPGSSR